MNDLKVIEHKNERVLTTEQLAEAYGCNKMQIMQNFNNNQAHFAEGKHYFKLSGDKLKEFKESIGSSIISNNLKYAPFIYLWTKRGAARHCKMLGTDRAWDMFDELEESYFNRSMQKPDSYMIENPVERAKRWIEEEEERQALAAKNKELTPKAEFYDTVANSETMLSMSEVAKVLDMGYGRNKIFAILRDKKILDNKNVPYQQYVDRGYFKLVEGSYTNQGNVIVTKTVYVKQKGIDYIRKLLDKEA